MKQAEQTMIKVALIIVTDGGWLRGARTRSGKATRNAKKYVEYMGGAAPVIARARDDFKAGNYRWVAQVMDQVVFADPTNNEARELAARAFEQLGCQSGYLACDDARCCLRLLGHTPERVACGNHADRDQLALPRH